MVNGGKATASTLTVNNSSADTYAGVFGGTGANQNLVNLTMAGSNILTLTGTSTYTGTTTFNSGILNVGSAGALGTSTLTFTGGTLQYSAANQADYSSRFANSSSAITIDTNSQNVTYASAMAASNSGGLTKVGAGNLVLTNASNAYTGATSVNAGTLTSPAVDLSRARR